MIQVTDLHKGFRDKPVHRGISFEVKRGEILTVIGGSGVGKSLLLKQIVGLVKPDRGSIRIDGKEITHLDVDELQEVQKMIGYVFQESALFDSLTVADNVAFGLCNLLKCEDESRVQTTVHETLSLVGLGEIERLKPAQLSGGMKKRVGIARAIAFHPQILLYDEPTTGLDPVMSDVISDLILKLKKEIKTTAIAVTHDMKSAYKISDRIAMLYEGKILEIGTPKQIQNSADPVVRQFISGWSRGPITVPQLK
ncbi:MAG: ABC transporter ATP-binding protein [Elusimicrobia bacterium]|nr:ABC transporter ATP-binding protein [Elusimicrobiota bacterium]